MGHHIEFLKLREGHEPQPDRDIKKTKAAEEFFSGLINGVPNGI